MKKTTAYVCEFCPRKRAYLSRSHCKEHEAKCFGNPATRSCATCQHLKHAQVWVGCDGFMWTPSCAATTPGEALTTGCPSWEQREYPDLGEYGENL